MRKNHRGSISALAIATLAISAALTGSAKAQSGYVTGDFHQHTVHTDGVNQMSVVDVSQNSFGLDWWAHSEHGGYTAKLASDGTTNIYRWMDLYGDTNRTAGVYAPQTLTKSGATYQSTLQEVLNSRALYPTKTQIQSLELNAPGHEHASTGLIVNQFGPTANVDALAQFEYQFDGSETATNGLSGWTINRTGQSASIAAATWLQTNYPTQSYFIPAHPERKNASDSGAGSGWTLKSLRQLNDAAPDVFFGFESMPGHQAGGTRGEYTSTAMGGGTYGGCGVFSARIGGVWDNMLAEGRNFNLFASSDFHGTVQQGGSDFLPGEYQKTYTNVSDVAAVKSGNGAQTIVDGLRSGNGFVVEGDLINALVFTITNNKTGKTAEMGQWLPMSAGDSVTATIKFKSPSTNNHGDMNQVNLIQLIAGDIVGKVSTSDYSNDICRQGDGAIVDSAGNSADISNAAILHLFDRNGADASMFSVDTDGYTTLSYTTLVDGQEYFRIRGTNNTLQNTSEVDAYGNPLLDMGTNTTTRAWNDLWFYSEAAAVPEPASMGLISIGALTLLARRRRA